VPAGVSGPLTALQNEIATLNHFMHHFGATIMEDYEYAMDYAPVFENASFLPDDQAQGSLADVVKLIQADRCWDAPIRDDVVIAVVDTGIDGSHPEFTGSVRAGSWEPPGDTPWTDWDGHGTMCAAIAAGTQAGTGRYNGVAPGVRLVACKTRFRDTELAAVYDYLTELVEEQKLRVVATNSYGIPSGAAPPPSNSAFTEALDDAITAGVAVVFSAGNYHAGHPQSCEPSTIWHYKCRADVLTVATCKLDHSVWSYSSRGPGELDSVEKPDVTAPTPANGAVLYGDSVRVLANGWGTSGAAPQAAGLAALLFSRRASLTSAQVFDHIRESAVPTSPGRRACEGRGIINCRAALDRV
jgi:serine protease AprX